MSPKWIEARQEAEKVVSLFKTVGGAPFGVGRFTTHVETRQSLTYKNEAGGKGNTNKIIMSEGRCPGEHYLSELVVYTGGRVKSFDVDAIRDRSANVYTRGSIDGWFEWEGRGDSNRKKGSLTLLRVDFPDGTFVNYFSGQTRRTVGNEDLVRDFPQKLNGRTVAKLEKLIDMKVPLMIDYEARAEELLILSELRPFVQAFLARGLDD